MNWLTKLRWVLYPLVFLFFFCLTLYITFPLHAMKDFVVEQLGTTISSIIDPEGYLTTNVAVDDLALWRLSGVKFKNLTISMQDPEEAAPDIWKIDSLAVRVGLFSLLRGKYNLGFDTTIKNGRIYGNASVARNNDLDDLNLRIKGIDFKQFTFLESTIGLPLEGATDINLNLEPGANISKTAKGELSLNISSFAFGPGSLGVPMPGFTEGLSLPKVKLGSLNGYMKIANGIGTMNDFALSGGDIVAGGQFEVGLNPNLVRSRLEGEGWFRVTAKFLQDNPKFQVLLDMIPDINSLRTADGKIPFHVRGTLDKPRLALGKRPVADMAMPPS